MKSKRTLKLAIALLALTIPLCQPSTGVAQGTAFTYQGELTDNGSAASGSFDLRFAIFNAASDGTQQGDGITNAAIAMSNGRFTVTLDFGPGVFTGGARWLEIGARTNGGMAFTTLSPRQRITATPYAIKATDALTVAMGTISNPLFLGTTTTAPLLFSVNNQTGLRLEYATDGMTESVNLIGGHGVNSVGVDSFGVVVAGGGALGFPNSVGAYAVFSALSGGVSNTIGDDSFFATLSGGFANTIASYSVGSVIGGGQANHIASDSSFAAILAGQANAIEDFANHGLIAGGQSNRIAGDTLAAAIGGGEQNSIGEDGAGSVIAGGSRNAIADDAAYATIGGGGSNHTYSPYSTIAGGSDNYIGLSSSHSAISGGQTNRIGANSPSASVGGGYQNVLGVAAAYSLIGGGGSNTIANSAQYALVSGGRGNRIGFDADFTTISGGENNVIGQLASHAVTAGGANNAIANSAQYAVVSGGLANSIGTDSDHAVISGGAHNVVAGGALDNVIGGGLSNNIASGAHYSTIPGGFANGIADDVYYAFAAGRQARANHQGAFVWADSQASDFSSTAPNQFLIRASGGAWFETGSAGIAVNGVPVLTGSIGTGQLNDGAVTPTKLASSIGVWTASGANVYRSSGRAGIGTTTPAVPLHVDGGTDTAVGGGGYVVFGDTAGLNISIDDNEIMARSNGVTSTLFLNVNGGTVGIATTSTDQTYTLRVNGSVAGVGNYNNISDQRYKENVQQLEGALDKILQVRGVSFDWKAAAFPDLQFEEQRQLGFVAQELAAVLPEAVSSDGDGILSVAYSKVIPVLVEAIKEQQTQMSEALHRRDAENASLRRSHAALEQRLAALERLILSPTAK